MTGQLALIHTCSNANEIDKEISMHGQMSLRQTDYIYYHALNLLHSIESVYQFFQLLTPRVQEVSE